jgi:hydroxymethylpyrimidine/phosphomethylpyrimidine kinase
VTGGHLDGPPIDVCFDGRTYTELGADRVDGRHTHGTGCTFSAALAARLAIGDDLTGAARAAKIYVTRAIAQAPGLGHGRGPLEHFPT